MTDITARVDSYVAEHETALATIYTLQNGDTANTMLFQPEALMIAELLEHNEPTELRTLWNTKFPESALEHLAVAFGHSFD